MTVPSSLFVLEQVPELREAVVRRTVRDVVADKIAMLIAAGILEVGDVLPSERELATALQVSRVTVRGAIGILSAHGIIEVSQGSRTRVVSTDVSPVLTVRRQLRNINSYDIEAVHAARLLVERRVVADAAVRIDEDTLAQLDAALAAQRAAADDPVRFLISDREFHV